MSLRIVVALAVAACAGAAPLHAQNSVYGIEGIGVPGRPVSVHARSLGGGTALFDPISALNPAAVAVYSQLVASATVGTGFRSFSAGDTTVNGLRETRFPLGMFSGVISGTPLSFALGYSTYAERTYDVTTQDTLILRDEPVIVTDRVRSQGAVVDLRGALAFRPGRRVFAGAAFHLLGGSARLNVNRSFSAGDYVSFAQQNDIGFSGTGVSTGVIARLNRYINVGAMGRLDGALRATMGSERVSDVALPVTLGAGVQVIPTQGITWSTTGLWRSWSSAAADLVPPTQAFDTWEIGSGIDLANAFIPLRLGARYAQLPFSDSTQPHEFTVAGGTGLTLAHHLATIDLAVERTLRSGAGVRERLWQVSVGIALLP